MDSKKDRNKNFGEFVPTYFAWTSLDEQKKRARELDDATKKDKK